MIPSARFADESARRRIRESLHESLLVEASAGTGKTTELVERIVNVLQRGIARIDQIVAVTFTNKAAGELKLRLRQGLDRRRTEAQDPEEAANLGRAIARLEEAAIGTIHAFCAQVLRERPVEARVDPDFEELDDQGARRLYASVFRRWLQAKLNQESPGLRRALARLSAREEREFDYTPTESLEFAGWQLVEWRDFPKPWKRAPFHREEVIDELVAHFQAMGSNLSRFKPDVVEPVRDLLPWIERRPRDYDMLESLLLKLHRVWKRRAARKPSDLLFDALEKFRPAMEADLAAQLRAELWEIVDLYDAQKRRAGKLDFVDLLLLTRNLVRDQREVRAYLQRRYACIFVDEFQDTDPLQAEILLLLSADNPEINDWRGVTPSPGKLFLVGDPKQSIYKFRRADVQLYQNLRATLEQRGVGVLRLSRSFRSVRSIQQFVNASFSAEMHGDQHSAQAEYVPLDEVRQDLPDQPALIALPAPHPYSDYGNITKTAINACLPGTVIGFVEWLLHESGWRVGEDRMPVRPRHVCILFRRFTNFGVDLTRDYVRALEDRGIPHLLVGSKTFHAREEIEAIRATLTAIEWPQDELSVFATLHGAFFAISDTVLLRFRMQYRRMNPFQELPADLPEEFHPIRQAFAILSELHRERNRRPIAETVYRLMEATRAWSAFAFRPAGHQALANARRVIDLARQFETAGGISFRGFVEELAAQADRADSAEAPVLEEGAEGVRIMTVHTAKGLEFPVVILADMTANLSVENPDRHVDTQSGLCAVRLLQCAPWELTEFEALEKARERAEGVRVAYVAATRARDLLVVPVISDEQHNGWLSPLNKALYPKPEAAHKPSIPPGCPSFGPVSVLNRPPNLFDETSVRPGLHKTRAGEHSVVWWDPSVLPAGQEVQFGIRQEDLLADEPGAEVAGVVLHQQWQQRRIELLEKGHTPAVEVVLASETQEPPPGWSGQVHVESTAQFSGRPAGKRFGVLIHAILRDVGLHAHRSEIEAMARLQGRILASDREEVEAAAVAVEAVLRHSLMERARNATRCHREYPVSLRLDSSRRLEGVIDLAFLESGSWVVVDFKTDHTVDQYYPQIAWYAHAIGKITGEPAQAYLLRV